MDIDNLIDDWAQKYSKLKTLNDDARSQLQQILDQSNYSNKELSRKLGRGGEFIKNYHKKTVRPVVIKQKPEQIIIKTPQGSITVELNDDNRCYLLKLIGI